MNHTAEEALGVAVGRGGVHVNVVQRAALGLGGRVGAGASPAQGDDEEGGEELHGQFS